MVDLLLDVGGEDFGCGSRRWVWNPQNTLAGAAISYLNAPGNCLTEQLDESAVWVILQPVPPSLYP